MIRQSCLACRHPERAQIWADHENGMSLRRLARRYGLSPSTLSRHFAQCDTESEKQRIAAATPLIEACHWSIGGRRKQEN